VTGDTDYSFLGNPEFGYAYLGFGVIMLLYAILIVIKYMKENSVEVTE
jgi:hypothetical protein